MLTHIHAHIQIYMRTKTRTRTRRTVYMKYTDSMHIYAHAQTEDVTHLCTKTHTHTRGVVYDLRAQVGRLTSGSLHLTSGPLSEKAPLKEGSFPQRDIRTHAHAHVGRFTSRSLYPRFREHVGLFTIGGLHLTSGPMFRDLRFLRLVVCIQCLVLFREQRP